MELADPQGEGGAYLPTPPDAPQCVYLQVTEMGQLRKGKEAQTALLHQMRRNVSVVFR